MSSGKCRVYSDGGVRSKACRTSEKVVSRTCLILQHRESCHAHVTFHNTESCHARATFYNTRASCAMRKQAVCVAMSRIGISHVAHRKKSCRRCGKCMSHM